MIEVERLVKILKYSVPESAAIETKKILELINEGFDSRKLFKAAYTFHRAELERKLAHNQPVLVQDGIFEGMELFPAAITSTLLPKWQGTYEKELTTAMENRWRDINSFLNIGCAEGYYLNGIARLLRIPCIGIDILEESKGIVEYTASKNGVSGYVSFKASIYDALQLCKGKLMILVDVEGAEIDVLNDLDKALKRFDAIHDIVLFIETNVTTSSQIWEDPLSGRSYGQNTEEIIDSLNKFNYSIEDIILQEPSLRFINANSNLTFLEQAVRGAEGRPGDQRWIIARKKPAHR